MTKRVKERLRRRTTPGLLTMPNGYIQRVPDPDAYPLGSLYAPRYVVVARRGNELTLALDDQVTST